MKSTLSASLFLVIFSILDFLCCTIFYAQGNKFKEYFIADIRDFDISSSFFELWIFAAVRFILYCGTYIGLMKNPKDGIKRMERASILIFALSASMWSYTIIKMLLYSETGSHWKSNAWFWGLFSWSIVTSLLFYINWVYTFHKLVPQPEPEESGGSSTSGEEEGTVNTSADDTERLISRGESTANQ